MSLCVRVCGTFMSVDPSLHCSSSTKAQTAICRDRMPSQHALLFFALFTLACATPPPSSPQTHGHIVALPSGEPLSFDELIDRLLEARVAYVGEHHDREADHRAQRVIFEALHDRDDALALGLEMVQHPDQPILDAFVAGGIDEAELLEGLRWDERWGFDFAFYRPLFALCREHGLPIVALNAPSHLTRAIARHGLETLSDAERALLPELDLESAEHRRLVEEALRGHPAMTDAMLERYYTAQVVWDETMAERVAAFLARSPRRLVVLAGAMHVRSGLGIPARAARRGAKPHAIVLPITASELDRALRTHPPIADFLWVIPESVASRLP